MMQGACHSAWWGDFPANSRFLPGFCPQVGEPSVSSLASVIDFASLILQDRERAGMVIETETQTCSFLLRPAWPAWCNGVMDRTLADQIEFDLGEWRIADTVPGPRDHAVTQPGDLWILGDHRLLCGDAGNAADVDRLVDTEDEKTGGVIPLAALSSVFWRGYPPQLLCLIGLYIIILLYI